MVKFALFTGLRRSEIFKLTWDDVDFNCGMITIRSPKGGKTQTLPDSPQALEVLRRLEVRHLMFSLGRMASNAPTLKVLGYVYARRRAFPVTSASMACGIILLLPW